MLMGLTAATPRARTSAVRRPEASSSLPTVEIIRGDKRAHEVVQQQERP
jgi:hypothetical protein